MKRASFGRKAPISSSIGPSCVMLHLPPPEMRILMPIRSFFSSSVTGAPSEAARQAAMIPAAPAPMTTTSCLMRTIYPSPFGIRRQGREVYSALSKDVLRVRLPGRTNGSLLGNTRSR